ncbi:minor structural protein VP3 [Betapolyomavirus mafricanus]|nr:minor structural protein VP3 [Betapolyomavirus mafricanus]AGA82595.1 minor structural protein VP3 [Betapolyomavirus mafricanus]
MALQQWFPPIDIDFPGLVPFARFINYINPMNWAPDLFAQLGRYFWDNTRQIGYATTDLAQRTGTTLEEMLARFFENARWAVSNLPANAYASLRDYYTELPSLNPPQIRAVQRRLGEAMTDRFHLQETTSRPESGHYVDRYQAPGGAKQRSAADWMLPLLLGLYGDITPAWGADIQLVEEEEDEDGPQKKKFKGSRSRSRSQASNKRGHRGPRHSNRPRKRY